MEAVASRSNSGVAESQQERTTRPCVSPEPSLQDSPRPGWRAPQDSVTRIGPPEPLRKLFLSARPWGVTGGVWAERVTGDGLVLSFFLITRCQGMDPRGDTPVRYAALLGAYWLESERDDLDAVVTREGGWSRAVMVICSAPRVAAAVALAVAARIA